MGFETLRRRPVDPAGDAAMLHGWVQEDRAEFWGMQEHTLEDVRDTYAWIADQPHLTAEIVEVDGGPLGLLQTYDPQVDEIGQHYDRQPGDLGIHLFMRPGARPAGSLDALMGFLTGELFADPSVQRVVMEPDVRNEKSIALVHRYADELGPVVELPHPVPGLPPKTAQFAFLRRPAGLVSPSVGAPLAGGFPSRALRGVLFDMDGTLIDSTSAVMRSWLQWSDEFGIDRAALAESHGRTSINTIREVMSDRPESEQLVAHARIREIELADLDGIEALAGAREAFEVLDELGIPHAIVTSCERELAGVRIVAAGLPRPTVVVTASDVSHGKPGPEPYELGASLLGLTPGDCMVVEDATAGLVSGRAAGAGALVAVLGTTPLEVLARDADVVLESVADIPWATLVTPA